MQGIFNIVFRICEDSDDANDITQDVCMKIMKALKNFKWDSEYKTWIYRIAYNEALQFLRSKKESVELDVVEYSLWYHDTYAGDIVHMEEAVQRAIHALPPLDKSIILMFYYDDLKIREIASIMDMNENTVKTRLSRAKDFLQPLLEKIWKHS